MATIGSILIQLRKNSNYTQEAVAISIGVTARTLYNYENVLVPIPDRRLQALCEFYGISIKELKEVLQHTEEEDLRLQQELTTTYSLTKLFSDCAECSSDIPIEWGEQECLDEFFSDCAEYSSGISTDWEEQERLSYTDEKGLLNEQEKLLKKQLEQETHDKYCKRAALKISILLTKFIENPDIDNMYKRRVTLDLLTKLFDFLKIPE